MSKLTQWAQIAEVVGAIAVVISILYAGYEIRQNTVASKADTFQRVSVSFADFTDMLASDKELGQTFVKGLEDADALAEAEYIQFFWAMDSFMHRLEGAFVLRESGIIDEIQFRGMAQICIRMTKNPGALDWLELNESILKSSFQKFVRNDCSVEGGTQHAAEVVPPP